jgi:hypothetical protein
VIVAARRRPLRTLAAVIGQGLVDQRKTAALVPVAIKIDFAAEKLGQLIGDGVRDAGLAGRVEPRAADLAGSDHGAHLELDALLLGDETRAAALDDPGASSPGNGTWRACNSPLAPAVVVTVVPGRSCWATRWPCRSLRRNAAPRDRNAQTDEQTGHGVAAPDAFFAQERQVAGIEQGRGRRRESFENRLQVAPWRFRHWRNGERGDHAEQGNAADQGRCPAVAQQSIDRRMGMR